MRLSHLAAVATIVALLGAMFVAMGSASAAPGDAVGDVTATSGVCATATINDAGENPIMVTTVAKVGDTGPTKANIAACGAGTAIRDGQAVKVTPNGTVTPLIEGLQPALVIASVGDSDGIFKAGSALNISLAYRNGFTNVEAPKLASLYVQGATSLHSFTGGVDASTGECDNTDTCKQLTEMVSVPIPAGTPAGTYTISAATEKFDHDDDSGDEATATIALTASREITVGDAGTDLASVSLTLGNEREDSPLSSANEQKTESGTAPARGGEIWLKIEAKNSLGGASNKVNGVTVIGAGGKFNLYTAAPAAGGKVVDYAGMPLGEGNAPVLISAGNAQNSATLAEGKSAAATMFLKVEKADSKPGQVTVYTLVIGADGAPRSEERTLIFSGPSSSLELGEPKALASGGKTEFSVKAMDAGGNAAEISQLSIVVMDSEGKGVSSSTLKAEKSTVGASTETTADDNPNAVAVLVTAGSGASAPAPGTYTVDVSLPSVANSKVSASVTVSGKAATIVASSDNTTPMVGDFVEVEAEVSDADGNPVADDVVVRFTAAGTATVVAVNAISDSNSTATDAKTKDGVAKALFYVSRGSGVTSILVTTRDTDAEPDKVSLTIGAEEEAMPEPEMVGNHCINDRGGFATWTCGVEAMASEVFALVQPEGATAIHLWSTISMSWVRYSVVDGTTVPGSSDFTVNEDDILYISN